MTKTRKVNIVTMGCSKNTVDSEKLSAILSSQSWEVSFDSEKSGHDAVIINTCGFINDAKRESIDMILKYAEKKKRGNIGTLFVMGCLSGRYGSELSSEIPEADGCFGVCDWKSLTDALGAEHPETREGGRIVSTPSHYAYLKISEGCDRTCSFCAIPKIRGRHVSTPADDLLREARMLSEKGVKDLILIAQDLTYYGIDIYGKPVLADLLEKLSGTEGIEWIRLHYAFPAHFPDNVLKVMRDKPNICRYIDIPLQHCSDNVLEKMRRGHGKRKTAELIEHIRRSVPGVAIRTTLLVGHPGESEEDFSELKQFVRDMKFERLGVFNYSHEEDTWSWNNYTDSVPEELKNRRASEIMAIQQEISEKQNAERVGKVYQVLIDREEEECFIGRTEFDSPEVDNEVIIKKPGEITPGSFYNVRIDSAGEFDLYGSIAE